MNRNDPNLDHWSEVLSLARRSPMVAAWDGLNWECTAEAGRGAERTAMGPQSDRIHGERPVRVVLRVADRGWPSLRPVPPLRCNLRRVIVPEPDPRRSGANQTLETNRRPRSPLGAGQKFERVLYDPAFLSGGGRSAFCWMTRVMKFEALSLLQCRSRLQHPSATMRSQYPAHSSRPEFWLHGSRHRFSSSSNLSPEATAVGSTGCVAAVFRRCGYSRRASAPCSA